ncbi:DUF1643 domain-containing protein [Loktanella sp. SALINAS62]|uniref:DUF1643 domain-containing protein n=1 Tax=Loktanella sp. SALINAS62 TaxID=2706124 RepID=UPI001B8D05CC|nr:DUF1643 domain-containing protein [Loktanella sp. SALINAS62]MBS1301896.1 DUF1643 domain-containing protein [Loktanella sp. SALINAS62]
MTTTDGLIHRHHTAADGTLSAAVYSPCESYRYRLTRVWGDAATLCFVMLNPSTATERANDPTIARCETRARAAGFGGLRIVNLFAFRATDPRALKRATAPIGPTNDRALLNACAGAGRVVAGWGVHGAHQDRATQVRALLRDSAISLHTLGLTKHGHPRHPLYVAYATQPEPWP